MKTAFSRWLDLILLAGLGFGPAGCLMGSDVNVSREGKQISPTTFEQVTPGETTAAWLQATLGEPSEKATVDSSTQIWKWSGTRSQQRSTWVFLILHAKNTDTTIETAAVELKDSVVVRKWRDRATQP